jgi:peptidoglycan hydrolase-like protein with peptidoglycan-binding domain
MAMTLSSYKTMLKSGAALVVALGLAAGLKPSPAQAGSKGALIGFGVGVATGVILNEAVNNNRRRRQVAPPPPRRRVAPARRRRVVTPTNANDQSEAMDIQAALNDLGYNAGDVDGIIGKGTRKAIRTFQRDIDENPTGSLTNKQKIILLDRAKVANSDGAQDNQNLAANQEQGDQGDGRNPNDNQSDDNRPEDNTPDDNQGDNDRVTSNNAGSNDPGTNDSGSNYDWTEVQEALNALGYPAGPENGNMTKRTRDAIMAFQTDISREPTGVLTAEEQGILFEDAEDLASDDSDGEDDDDRVVQNDQGPPSDDDEDEDDRVVQNDQGPPSDDEDEDEDRVVLLGSDPSSEDADNGDVVTNNLVITEYRAVSSISDPLQQLKAVRDARQNPPGFVAGLSATERLARESQLSQLESDVKEELLTPIVEQADSAPVSVAGVRQIAALEGSAESVFAVIGQQESAPYRTRLRSRQQRIMAALVSDQIGELKSYPQSLDGLQQSAAWYERFTGDYAGFDENPVVVDAMDTFEADRNARLTAMFPEFERNVEGMSNPEDDAPELMANYLSWQGDEALPISLEYKFVVAQHQ